MVFYKKQVPDIHSPICHSTRDHYLMYYNLSPEAFRYKLKNKKVIPMYMPIYKKLQHVGYKKIYVDSFDILYWLDINGQIDLSKVVKENPVIGINRRRHKKSKTLQKVINRNLKRVEKYEAKRRAKEAQE